MTQQIYVVKGMDCADCAHKIEKGVRQVEGVRTVHLDFATGLLQVEGETSPAAVQKRVSALGYSLEEKRAGGQSRRPENAVLGFWQFLLNRHETRLALIGGAFIVLALLLRLVGLLESASNVILVLALAVAGYPIARSALANLWINRDFSINLLMTIAAVGAVLIGEYTESATLIFLFAIAEALEGYTTDRARGVLGELNNLAPTHATRFTGTGEEVIPVEALLPGDEIVIRSGERIPMDGVVSSGQSAVNQAPITGESMPVDKMTGDELFAGTVNGSGTLHMHVTRAAAETTIQRVIRMIEQAQNLRAPTQRFIDRFAQFYTPAMILLALLVAGLPPLLLGEPFLNPPGGGTGWLYRALALLVIACPCALVISAPVTVVSAITSAARRGVLFKGGAYLEALSEIRVFAFDKTGTLTLGLPQVTTFRSVDCQCDEPALSGRHPADSPSNCNACDDLLGLASALEKRSTHPLAKSVLAAAEERGVTNRYPTAQDVTALAGSGLQGQVNGKLATIGNHKLFDLSHPHEEKVCNWVQNAEDQGQTTMLVCDGDRVRGFIAVADTIREESRQTIAEMKRLGKHTIMLTGDNPSAAHSVGQQIGVDQVQAGLLPADKVIAVQALAQQYGRVAMVGDGINDAPALASATLGIAMGGAGSDQAMETADVVLMGSDLKQIPFAVRLSAFARSLIRANVIFSLVTKLIFVLLTLAGLTSLWMAVVADMGVSLLVTLNGMRAHEFKG
jgi:Zn2+/Cd2+-exporting ATPase